MEAVPYIKRGQKGFHTKKLMLTKQIIVIKLKITFVQFCGKNKLIRKENCKT